VNGSLLPHAACGEGVSKYVQRMPLRTSGDRMLNRTRRKKVMLVLKGKG